ncbi:MAG: DUF3151 family protein [Acidimicrobiales bacterium]
MTSSVSFTAGTPETVLPPIDRAVAAAIDRADALGTRERRSALADIAGSNPRCLDAWANLAEVAEATIDRYAFARVGYHRGLDTLRAAGWRGAGYVRWAHPSNRGFLRCLDALHSAAAAIGEADEEERCAIFLRQLDPEWPPSGRTG